MLEHKPNKKRHPHLRKTLLLVVVFVVYSVVATLLFDTACIFKHILGVPCPSCGMTRAHLLFISGDFWGALNMHPLFFLGVPIFIFALIPIFKPTLLNPKLSTTLLIVFTSAFIVTYIIRMSLLFPHTAPMDYNTKSLLLKLKQFITAIFNR